MCVRSVFGLFSCIVWSLLDMLGVLLEASLRLPHCMGFYMWALVTWVGKIVVVVRSSGCRCLGDRALLQLRATTVARGRAVTRGGE